MVNYFELIQPFGGIMCQLMREEKARKKSEWSQYGHHTVRCDDHNNQPIEMDVLTNLKYSCYGRSDWVPTNRHQLLHEITRNISGLCAER
jgi:hypothetical protein